MRIVKLAASPEQNKNDISKVKSDVKDVERDIRDVKKDIKSVKSDITKIQNDIKGLNMGSRRFYQQQTVFTTIQRKLERFEKIEAEWKKYKENMDSKIKSLVEKRTQSRPQ